jgi:hypothetical protein
MRNTIIRIESPFKTCSATSFSPLGVRTSSIIKMGTNRVDNNQAARFLDDLNVRIMGGRWSPSATGISSSPGASPDRSLRFHEHTKCASYTVCT